MKQHILLASSFAAIIISLYLLNKIGFILATTLLILLFPYISFSIFFYIVPSRKLRRELAIDIEKRKFFKK